MIHHIIQIGPYPLSSNCIHGGVEASIFGLVQEFAKQYVVDVFDFPRIGEKDRVERYGSLTIHRYSNPGTHNKDAVSRLSEMAREIATLAPDVCHIHGTGTFSKELYFVLCNYNKPVIVTVHGLVREEKKQALLRRPSLKALYQYILQSRDESKMLTAVPRIIVDTAYVEDKLRTYGLRYLPEMSVIPQGIDEAFYSVHCNPNSKVLLSVGAISPRKGHIYTVDMFNHLRARGIEVRLRIIGSLADKAYYEFLRQKISASPYKDDISLEANLPRNELFKAYADAKLFVLHSQEESQGIVFAEAMATGLPVVATKIGGIPYVVTEGMNGLLCPYADVETMTDNVERLMTDNELWKQYSAAAREIAKDYSWAGIAARIINLYNF